MEAVLTSSESLHPPLDDPLLRVEEAGFCVCGPGAAWLGFTLKNAFPGRPLLGGDGDMEGEDADDVEGFWLLLPGGVMWVIPGQKDGFQAVG